MSLNEHQLSQVQTESIRALLGIDDFWVHLSPLGASNREMYRRDLRRSLIEFLTSLLKSRSLPGIQDLSQALSELISLVNTNKIPQTSFANISISHCPVLGGYAITPSNQVVGFDMEITSRIHPSTIQRITRAEDQLHSLRDRTHLWVAKEAAFKALHGDQQLNVMTDIMTERWQHHCNDLSSFQFQSLQSEDSIEPGRGVVLDLERIKMGFAII